MSKSIALRNYNGGNPGLRLVGAVIPGTRNFNHAIARVFYLTCTIGFVSGAYYLMGGDWRSLWQMKPMVAVLGLTFAYAMHEIGFHSAMSGLVSAVVGAHRDDGEFSNHVEAWSRRAAHTFLILNALFVWNSISNVQEFLREMGPGVYGYFYAMMFGSLLRTHRGREQSVKGTLTDQLFPLAFVALCYVAYTRWLA